jgi:SAM-dependent methyltransferase
MGELFEQRQPGAALDWTGERLVSGIGGQIEIEHLHRYMLARDLCRGLDVLDVASGEGYGTALLAEVARSAVGVEVSEQAAGHAAAQYRLPNLRFVQGDARKIPLADGSVDAVVSFETIEHFYEHDAFVAEVRRVLRPGGVFLISSPDRDIYSPPGSEANPYHKRELSRAEFAALLGGAFAHVRLLCQRPMLGSVLLSDDGAARPVVTFERRGAGFYERSDGISRSPYLVALASDAELPPLPDSIYVAESEIGPVMSRAANHDPVQAALAETIKRAEAAEAAFHASRAEIETCMREAAAERGRFEARIADLHAEYQAAETGAADAERAAAEAALDAMRAERDEAVAAADAARTARDTLEEELRQACAQRDMARLSLRRAAVFAENGWRNRVTVLEAEVAELTQRVRAADAAALEWNARYHVLRGRLERFLRSSGLFGASRLVPRPVRRFIRSRLFSAPQG